jgi:hypothetical protein
MKAPYGQFLAKQKEALEKMRRLCETMRKPNYNRMLPFQNGIVSSIRALCLLYDELHSNYHVQYIMTRKLNQDCLENYFSQLRYRGGPYDHPTAVSAIYRIRMLILGNNPNIATDPRNLNTIDCSSGDDGDDDVGSVTMTHALLNKVLRQPPSPSDNNTRRLKNPDEGVEIIAGFVAFKNKDIPDLALEKSQISKVVADDNWTRMLTNSYGLTHPSNYWLSVAEKTESIFLEKCGNKISEDRGIVQYLCNAVQKEFADSVTGEYTIPKKPLKTLVRLRLFIRIRSVNEIEEAASMPKRKDRKMEKIVK